MKITLQITHSDWSNLVTHTAWFCSLDFFLPMSHTCFAHLRLPLAHALEQALPGLSGCTVAPEKTQEISLAGSRRLLMTHACALRLRACLHGVGDPGLVGLVSFVFTLWGAQNKRNLPHLTVVPHSM